AARELLSGFPTGMITADPELAVLAGANARMAGSPQEAERYLGLALRRAASVPEHRRERFEIALALVRQALARGRNDLDAVAEESHRVLSLLEATESIEVGLGEDLRASVLANLGIAEMWAGRLEDAERDLERALAGARRS